MTNVRRAAVVTGAASGIGAATAERFAAEGYGVLLIDVSSTGEAIAEKLTRAGGTASFVATDVRDSQQIAAAVGQCLDAYGRVDCMVNCAGIDGASEPLLEFSESDLSRVMAVNVNGVMFGMQHAARAMMSGGTGGSIVNISSVAANVGIYGLSVYSASKGAVLAATRVAAAELGKHGIRVNAVCPGMVQTAMMDQSSVVDEKVVTKTARRIPLRRTATPAELAEVVHFLGSPRANYITGAVVTADGGMTAALS